VLGYSCQQVNGIDCAIDCSIYAVTNGLALIKREPVPLAINVNVERVRFVEILTRIVDDSIFGLMTNITLSSIHRHQTLSVILKISYSYFILEDLQDTPCINGDEICQSHITSQVVVGSDTELKEYSIDRDED